LNNRIDIKEKAPGTAVRGAFECLLITASWERRGERWRAGYQLFLVGSDDVVPTAGQGGDAERCEFRCRCLEAAAADDDSQPLIAEAPRRRDYQERAPSALADFCLGAGRGCHRCFYILTELGRSDPVLVV